MTEGKFKVCPSFFEKPIIVFLREFEPQEIEEMSNELLVAITFKFWGDGDPVKKAVLSRMMSPNGF